MTPLIALLLACGPDPQVVLTGLTSPNPAIREDMVRVARKVDDPEVVQALVRLLDDPSAAIRAEACDSLAALGATDAVPALVGHLDDPDADVRRAAVDALGRLEDPRATEPLIAYVQRALDRGEAVPLNALWALGNIGDPRALPLLSRLRESPDDYVRYNADVALKHMGPGQVEVAASAGVDGDG